MIALLPKNAFAYFNLSPDADNKEIMLAVMNKMKQNPQKMAEIAEQQKLLLDPESRFLIEFLYYFNSQQDLAEEFN